MVYGLPSLNIFKSCAPRMVHITKIQPLLIVNSYSQVRGVQTITGKSICRKVSNQEVINLIIVAMASERENSDPQILIMSSDEVPLPLINMAHRVQALRQVVDLVRGWDSEVALSKSSAITGLSNVKKNLREIKAIYQKLGVEFQATEEVVNKGKYLKHKCLFILNNIPDRFNCPSNVIPLNKEDSKVENKAVLAASSRPIATKKTSIPEIQFLTLDEFEKVPKYMKGRATYDKVNTFIELLNNVLAHKYGIFREKKSTLKKKDADLWNEYNKQELKETKGLYFCVANDLKNAACALDKPTSNLLTILRHCGRIREIRTGGILRYVAIF